MASIVRGVGRSWRRPFVASIVRGVGRSLVVTAGDRRFAGT
ncbi:unnamed protein product [[Actinomadura] parvosata subsp. kistnae]|nr:unnamed protein product [Actinomadura parvosata subsp. kistnae]